MNLLNAVSKREEYMQKHNLTVTVPKVRDCNTQEHRCENPGRGLRGGQKPK
jgi:hypothetical protein